MKSTTTILLIVSLMASLWCSDVFGQGATNTGALQATIRDPDFWLGTSVNVIGTGLFVTRVHAPKAARWFGHGTKLLGIPALTLSIIDIHQKTTDLATWANLAYATWAMGATAIDNVRSIQEWMAAMVDRRFYLPTQCLLFFLCESERRRLVRSTTTFVVDISSHWERLNS
jgi:hypothetical protein